ncbi:MAG: hypothetical protein AAGH65_10635, partial [Pseudomonadota bacterium]
DTEALRASNDRLEASTAAIQSSLDALNSGIDSGGLITNPDTPEAHYHNARVHELSGNYSAARQSYLAYFRSDLAKLDPHLRFVDFLRVQEGPAGARETYALATANSEGSMPAYVRLLLLDPVPRIQGLEQYLQQHPDFAPVAYHLSLEYSERRLGSQTLADQRKELHYIEQFQQLDRDGGLVRFMVDQDLVSEWRDDAQARLVALQNNASSRILDNPVTLSWMGHNAGWNGNIQISEPVQDILWNIQGETEPESTGSSGYNDPNTGRPAPRMFFTLPRNQAERVIEIRYTDLAGSQQGPFEFTFKPTQASLDDSLRMLDMTRTSWLSFREFDGNLLLYFTHLMMHRGSIQTIEYGLDRELPDRSYRFPAWNQPGLAPLDESTTLYISVDRNTQYATVQLIYKNGTQSPIVRIDR